MGIPIAREGAKIISFFFILFAVSFIFKMPVLSWCLGILFLFVCSFFRDPRRNRTRDENTIYSPADGKITRVEEVTFDGQAYSKIVIFLSVFNCHINRVPYKGQVISTTHVPGKFLAAFRHDIDE
ncbi:phosphatidylserine decarboxylase family protein, partial [Candidatus Marinamargulisbacteria bacterium SCGC AG-439-L15]